MPRLLLVLGSRGAPVDGLLRSLAPVGEVVVLTSCDVLGERVDRLGPAVTAIVARNRQAMVSTALSHHLVRSVDGVVPVTEDTIEIAATLSHRLRLPGQPIKSMPALRDKLRQRDALRASGVPGPPYARVRTLAEVREALTQVPLPAVLKPCRGSGGALARRIEPGKDVAAIVSETLALRAGARGAVDPDTALILESVLVGTARETEGLAAYVSVETLAARGRFYHLCVTDRFPVAPPLLETGMMLPSCLGAEQQATVVAMAERALRALNFRHGAAHTELMLTPDGPRVIEVNARIGGAVPFLLPIAAEYDVVTQIGRLALGQAPDLPNFSGRFGVFVAPQHQVGKTLESVAGLAEARTIPGVQAVIPVATQPGTDTTSYQHTMMAAVLAAADSPAEAVQIHRRVHAVVQPHYREAAAIERLSTVSG